MGSELRQQDARDARPHAAQGAYALGRDSSPSTSGAPPLFSSSGDEHEGAGTRGARGAGGGKGERGAHMNVHGGGEGPNSRLESNMVAGRAKGISGAKIFTATLKALGFSCVRGGQSDLQAGAPPQRERGLERTMQRASEDLRLSHP